ncbi:MAG TPA: M20/M25/M40 family metallo-hydrolase, partial [Thermoanaerobaculia bacterium]|nr:M20/M25/M40 family metallo-hydrolase [Thermoanaerobaculia bacterium]
MRGAGLERVEAMEEPGSPPLRNLTGVVAGQTEDEILLAAHYDTVAASPGAGDDASGCAAVLAAAADLRRTPLRHTVRVVLFDGEEQGLRGSRAWVEGLEPDRRDRVLAGLVVEMVGWGGSAGPALHILPARRPRTWAIAPGWLVHAALRAGDAAGWRLAVGDPRLSAAAQLLVRSVAPHHASDADALLEAGIPAVLLSDSSLTSFDPAYHQPFDRADRLDGARLERWVNVLAAAARRLDALAGRPVYEDRFLVLGGRVWQRRELYWAGCALWVALVTRARLERRRPRSAGDTPRGSSLPLLLPGIAFRLLFLVATLALPVFAALLLFPAAILALLAPRRRGPRQALQAAGLLPLAAFLGVLALAVQGG